jgi:Ca2+/H+ antiporter, TMEM165/GDT1 family
MVVADGLAILVGVVAGKHLPERIIQIVAAALFLVFGLYMLADAAFPSASAFVIAGVAITAVVLLGGILRALPERWRPAVMKPDKEPSPNSLRHSE